MQGVGEECSDISSSFQSLLLKKVNKNLHDSTTTRRKIDTRGKVIALEGFLNEIRTKTEETRKTKVKKVKQTAEFNVVPDVTKIER